MSSDTSSEWFLNKVRRAHEALSVSARDTNVNTLSASFGTKWPYKRTISAPATMPPHPDTRHGQYHHCPITPLYHYTNILIHNYTPKLAGDDFRRST